VKHFSDALAESIIAKHSVVCVGLDPDLEQMPPRLVARYSGGGEEGAAACAQEFCCRIVEAVAGAAAVVKPQAAFFEQFGPAGWAALRAVVRCAHEHGLPVILDAKRGDIASTGRAYARALFGGAELPGGGVAEGLAADAITASPYLGEDSLGSFTEFCGGGKGVFVLTRTSNPGAATLQERQMDGRPLYLSVAELVGRLGEDCVGEHGYSDVGAVAGATAPQALNAVRALLPRAFILVPGYGAQGGSAGDLAGLRAGVAAGVVVNASRSIISAWRGSDREYAAAAADAAGRMRDELVGVLGA
jgi:orotidine-5'-phosphate decarboxylase